MHGYNSFVELKLTPTATKPRLTVCYAHRTFNVSYMLHILTDKISTHFKPGIDLTNCCFSPDINNFSFTRRLEASGIPDSCKSGSITAMSGSTPGDWSTQWRWSLSQVVPSFFRFPFGAHIIIMSLNNVYSAY